MEYFLSECKPELSPKAAGPDTTCWLQVTVLTMAMGWQSAFLHPAVLHQGTTSPRTLMPASPSLPAAHVHHYQPVWMHQHSLASDSVQGLPFGRQPLETTQVQLRFQLSVTCFPQGHDQTTLNSTPKHRRAQI